MHLENRWHRTVGGAIAQSSPLVGDDEARQPTVPKLSLGDCPSGRSQILVFDERQILNAKSTVETERPASVSNRAISVRRRNQRDLAGSTSTARSWRSGSAIGRGRASFLVSLRLCSDTNARVGLTTGGNNSLHSRPGRPRRPKCRTVEVRAVPFHAEAMMSSSRVRDARATRWPDWRTATGCLRGAVHGLFVRSVAAITSITLCAVPTLSAVGAVAPVVERLDARRLGHRRGCIADARAVRRRSIGAEHLHGGRLPAVSSTG